MENTQKDQNGPVDIQQDQAREIPDPQVSSEADNIENKSDNKPDFEQKLDSEKPETTSLETKNLEIEYLENQNLGTEKTEQHTQETVSQNSEESISDTQRSDSIESDSPMVLASRWNRLFASMVDGLILTLLVLPIWYLTGILDLFVEGNQPVGLQLLLVALISVSIFTLINGKLLIQNGQTLGKKAFDIKIVTYHGEAANLTVLLKRYAVYFGLNYIPVVGSLLNFANALCIFGKKKQCMHDIVADTVVIDVK